jgi:hypothetical protein
MTAQPISPPEPPRSPEGAPDRIPEDPNAPLRLCHECSAEVRTTADNCPYCGASYLHSRGKRLAHRVSRMSRRSKITLGTVILAVLVGGIATGVVLKVNHDNAVAAQQAVEAREAAAQREQRQARAAIVGCERMLGGLDNSLTDLGSRLNGVGLNFSEYTSRVGNAEAAYGRLDTGELSASCAANVGVHLENALNAFAAAGRTWNDCFSSLYCENAEIEPTLQAKWLRAEIQLEQAHSGYQAVTPAGSGGGGLSS